MNLIDPDRHQYWNSDIRKHLCCEKLFTKKTFQRSNEKNINLYKNIDSFCILS